MKRFAPTAWAMLACGFGATVAAPAALAANRCVGNKPGCYSTIQAAIDAAQDGDTIRIAPGTHAGGVTVDVSVAIVGAGAGSTIIKGGGPVLTIGVFGAATEPTVSVSGVTITDGVTNTSPDSVPAVGVESAIARGGGISIPPNAARSGGATVTIRNSVIRDNSVAPTATFGPTPDQVPFWPACPSGPCRAAGAFGGGIDNWGALTLIATSVRDNQVGGPVASDAEGAGIWSLGTLVLKGSVVSGNRATAVAPNGRFANSGGIFAVGGALTIDNSVVSDNTADLSTALPSSVEQLANSGGIHVTAQATATIRNSRITGNSISATNTVGDANAFSGGVHADATITLINDVISDNRVVATAPPGSPGNAFADSGGGELAGTIANTRFIGNSVTATAAAGEAIAAAGATIFTGSMQNSMIVANRVTATSGTGPASVFGAGLHTGGVLDMRNTTVSGNAGAATGASGLALGGGIANEPLPGGPPLGLSLSNSLVTRNSLTASPGITIQGGGIFSTEAVTLLHSVIAHNTPDQCVGC